MCAASITGKHAWPSLYSLARCVASRRAGRDHHDVRSFFTLAIVVVLVMLIAASRAKAAEPEPKAPEPGVLASLRPGHPRLLVLDDDIARLKRQIKDDRTAAKYFEHIRDDGDKMLTEPPVERVLIGPRLLSVSRKVVERVTTLGGLYRLTGEEKYAKRCRDEMLAAAKFSDWNPSHFLDVAEMTNALGIGYDWIYPTLTDGERGIIRSAIIRKGLEPGLKVYQSPRGWHTRTNNWNQVCNGGLTVGALAIADEEPDVARQIITNARESIPLAMNQFAPDGGCIEGPGYWSYATRYTCFYLAAIQTALNTDFGFLDSPGFRNTGLFRIHTIGPLNRTFNFADAGENAGNASQMFYLARSLNRPFYAAHERRFVTARAKGIDAFHLLWFDADEGDISIGTSSIFRGVEVATFRSAWDDVNAAFVGFKGGDNAASHANLDLGSFVYDANGVRWAQDLGPDDYNLPGYFGKQRWTYYRLRTEGQNTITLDGENQNLTGKAKIVTFSGGPERKFAVADLSDGYSGQATRVTRGVALIGKQLLVQDEIEAPTPVEVIWHMHTPAKIVLDADGKHAVLTQGGKSLEAYVAGEAGARFEVAVADPPPPVEPDPPMRAKATRNSQKLIVRLPEKVTKALLVVTLVPEGETAPQRRIDPLRNWK